MAKSVCASDVPAYAGLDVGEHDLVLALRMDESTQDCGSFTNDKAGIRALIKRLQSLKRPIYACMEATGAYYPQAATALTAAKGIRVMVANPHKIKAFAGAMNRRSKTDKADAQVIALYAEKARFIIWEPPADNIRSLRIISRRIDDLTRQAAAEKCRLHALRAAGESPRCVEKSVLSGISSRTKEIKSLRKEALAIIKADGILRQRYLLLLSIPGVGEATAVRILAELCALPKGLAARQWVAYAGLDPVHRESGTSIRMPSRISRAGNARLRSALFFAAMVASWRDPHVRAFTQKLVQRGKKKIQAIVAAMRKLLHAIWGMFNSSTTYDGAILFPNLLPNPLTRQ
jgi:transposase